LRPVNVRHLSEHQSISDRHTPTPAVLHGEDGIGIDGAGRSFRFGRVPYKYMITKGVFHVDFLQHRLRYTQGCISAFSSFVIIGPDDQHSGNVAEDSPDCILAEIPKFGDFFNGVVPLRGQTFDFRVVRKSRPFIPE
jgi:hypothetical protein